MNWLRNMIKHKQPYRCRLPGLLTMAPHGARRGIIYKLFTVPVCAWNGGSSKHWTVFGPLPNSHINCLQEIYLFSVVGQHSWQPHLLYFMATWPALVHMYALNAWDFFFACWANTPAYPRPSCDNPVIQYCHWDAHYRLRTNITAVDWCTDNRLWLLVYLWFSGGLAQARFDKCGCYPKWNEYLLLLIIRKRPTL